MANGITFDKAIYKPGEKVTATVVDDRRTKSESTKYDTAVGSLTGTFTIRADGTLTSPGHTWTAVSDDGTTAVFTTTA